MADTIGARWDDPDAGKDLIKAIRNNKFYGKSNISISNHLNINNNHYYSFSLCAYDGDQIDSQNVANKGAHAFLTMQDLELTMVAYTRGSLLSAGLTESVWDDSVNGKISAVGFTGENGKDYFK